MFDIQAVAASARVTLLGSGNRGGIPFEPARDIPSLVSKVILITGGAGDLGKQVAIELARHKPTRIYIADLPREDRGESVVAAIRGAIDDKDAPIRYLEVDLSSFESIKTAVTKFRAVEGRLDIAVLNAGIMRVRPGTTTEGYKIAFGINYLGHALLTKLLMPTLLHTAEQPGADVRIVGVSSEGHATAPKGGIVFDKLKGPCEEISKVAIIAYARELAERYPQIKVVTVHPGRIITRMAHGLRKESLLFQAVCPYFAAFLRVPSHWGNETTVAKDPDLSKKWWGWTEKELERVK
ncbi:hypothetical protein MFIFM68171_09643 [Madurella fahalii]|uniref:NAD(P)-binding protein n=1 Tax=Madurella fahalii TaxID=1157608 RepID=A0ABQ0GNX0_9PEZI